MKKTLLSVVLTMVSIISYSTTLTVTNTDDTGPGSLRAQIAAASAGDTIVFDASLNNSTISFYSGDIDITQSITILGPGRSLLTLDGVGATRAFHIMGADVTIRGLTFAYCKQTDAFNINHGGAIYHQGSGNLTLSNINFYNNQAVNSNGSQGGALAYHAIEGHVSLDSCVFTACYSDNYGGALSLNNSSSSGSIKNCVIHDNTVQGGRGVIFINLDTVEVINTSITGNYGRGAVIDATSCDEAVFINVTISNNTDINNQHIIHMPEQGVVKMINCTYKDNNMPLSLIYEDDSVTFIFQNSIFDNTGDNFVIDTFSEITIISLGGNVSNDTTGQSILNATNDKNDVNPMLGALEGDYNEAKIHPLNCGSPAFNNGIANGAPATDQRGMARYRGVDAGAYEQQPTYGTDVQVACRNYVWNGVTYTASNSAIVDTIASSMGCDSIVTLNLTVNNVSSVTTTVTDSLTITADNANGTYQWLDCNNGMSVIADSTNQSINPQGSGNYAVEITENGCVDTSDCVNFIRSSILKNTFSTNLSVYPNPTSGSFAISFANIQEEIVVELVTISGQVLGSRTYNNTNYISLNVKQPNGVYLLKVKDNKGNSAIIKLIKN